MSPILGIWASQISGHLWAPAGAYDALASIKPDGSVASITFAGIPTGYKHLQIRAIIKGTSTSGGYANLCKIEVNSDTTATNYYTHVLNGDGSSAGAGASNSNSTWALVTAGSASSANGAYSAHVLDILDYADTSKYKTMRGLAGIDINGGGGIALSSVLWKNTNAITSITILNNDPTYFGNFTTGSSFALYGVK